MSSTLSVSEVDNNSFRQTVQVKEKKKYCDNHLALYSTFNSWLHSLQATLCAALNDSLLSWKHHDRHVADLHCHWKSLTLRKNIPVYPHQPVSETSNNFNKYAQRKVLYTLRIYKFLDLYYNIIQIEKNWDIFERLHIPLTEKYHFFHYHLNFYHKDWKPQIYSLSFKTREDTVW